VGRQAAASDSQRFVDRSADVAGNEGMLTGEQVDVGEVAPSCACDATLRCGHDLLGEHHRDWIAESSLMCPPSKRGNCTVAERGQIGFPTLTSTWIRIFAFAS